MFGSGLATDLAQLLAWRFIAGAGSAMYMTGAVIYLTDISGPENRARFIGTNQAALLLGVSIGPGLGGVIAEVFGLRMPFYFVGGLALVAAVYAYFRIPETRQMRAPREERHPTQPATPAAGRPWLRMLRSRDFVAVSLVTLSIFFTRTASWQTLVPLIGATRLDMSPGTLGAMFTGVAMLNLLLITPSAMAADRFGRKATIVPALCVVAAGLLLVAGAQALPLFLVAALVMGVGQALSGPAPAAYAADIAPPESRGLAMGINRTAGDLGFVVGPPVVGLIADASSFGWGLATNALLLVAVAATFAVVARETRARSARAPVSAIG
jgi:MFS family permease